MFSMNCCGIFDICLLTSRITEPWLGRLVVLCAA
uniref:Uncharacterized protein n=1 Tax=Arundo donax TaxID=35708 RepID=A0A0A9CUQ6_ARUDO